MDLGLYQKTFFTAKFAKQSQRSQRGNYLFIKMLRILYPVAFFAVILNCELLTFDIVPYAIFKLKSYYETIRKHSLST